MGSPFFPCANASYNKTAALEDLFMLSERTRLHTICMLAANLQLKQLLLVVVLGDRIFLKSGGVRWSILCEIEIGGNRDLKKIATGFLDKLTLVNSSREAMFSWLEPIMRQ